MEWPPQKRMEHPVTSRYFRGRFLGLDPESETDPDGTEVAGQEFEIWNRGLQVREEWP